MKHFEPKPVIIAERFQFHRRNQAVGETAAEYEAELRKLATHCAFGEGSATLNFRRRDSGIFRFLA